jgi:hypothetical protein
MNNNFNLIFFLSAFLLIVSVEGTAALPTVEEVYINCLDDIISESDALSSPDFASELETKKEVQSYNTTTRYYNGSPFSIPGKIKLEEYDLGGEGVAYHDIDENKKMVFRTEEDVDVVESKTVSGEYFIGFIEPEEWIEYSIDVKTEGDYDLVVSYASGEGGGSFKLLLDGNAIGETIRADGTGGWQNFETKTISGYNLPAGEHILRVYMETGDFNLNYLEFFSASSCTEVSGIDVPEPIAICIDGNERITPSVIPANACNRNVTWSSLDESIASVQTDGTITGKSEGNTVITVTTVEGGFSKDINISVVNCGSCRLINPGFEEGIENWTINKGVPSISDDATEGTNALVLRSGDVGVEQAYKTSVTEGTTITLNFDAKVSSDALHPLVGIDFRDASRNKIHQEKLTITNEEYQSLSITYDAPEGTMELTAWAFCFSGSLYVDNLCINTPTALGVDENMTESLVWPNPFDQIIKITGTEMFNNMVITNIQGEVVMVAEIGGDQQSIDASMLNPGVYFIRLNNEVGNTIVHKLIKR